MGEAKRRTAEIEQLKNNNTSRFIWLKINDDEWDIQGWDCDCSNPKLIELHKERVNEFRQLFKANNDLTDQDLCELLTQAIWHGWDSFKQDNLLSAMCTDNLIMGVGIEHYSKPKNNIIFHTKDFLSAANLTDDEFNILLEVFTLDHKIDSVVTTNMIKGYVEKILKEINNRINSNPISNDTVH